MQNLSRRTMMVGSALTAGALGGILGPMSIGPAQAAPTKIKLFVSPHPDDEILRGAGEVNYSTLALGYTPVLLAMCNGDGTGMGRREGLTPAAVAERRMAEQVGAWSAITAGRGQIIQMGYSDGTLTYQRALDAIRQALAAYPGAEVFSCAHPWDPGASVSPDHVETWTACRDSGAAVVRYLKDPTYSGGGTGTNRPVNVRDAEDAVKAYWWTLGPRSSVGTLRNALVSSGYRSRYTRS